MNRLTKLLSLTAALMFPFAILGCDVDTEGGDFDLPSVDVTPGDVDLPETEVNTADVDVDYEPAEDGDSDVE